MRGERDVAISMCVLNNNNLGHPLNIKKKKEGFSSSALYSENSRKLIESKVMIMGLKGRLYFSHREQ